MTDFSNLLPAEIIAEPKDGNGEILHEGDRVYSYDLEVEYTLICYGTLTKSNHPATIGHWCVDYDDGESYIVLDFDNIWKDK